MGFQKHETPVQKFLRKCKYIELRESGEICERARRFRDWTLNKVRMIASKIANPP